MGRKSSLPLRGVIENMCWFTVPGGTRYDTFGQGGSAELAEELGVPLLGHDPRGVGRTGTGSQCNRAPLCGLLARSWGGWQSPTAVTRRRSAGGWC